MSSFFKPYQLQSLFFLMLTLDYDNAKVELREGMAPKAASTPTDLKKAVAAETGIGRPPMNQRQYDEEYGAQEISQVSIRKQAKRCMRSCVAPCSSVSSFASSLLSFVPIVRWLPRYNYREDLVNDAIGGITVGIMHVPQGLAYSTLARVAPVNGLYTSCFPAFFYLLFGTSRHCSVGSFAVVTLMAGMANDNIMAAFGGRNSTFIEGSHEIPGLTTLQVASTLTFAMGLIQFLSGMLHLEFLTSYLSDPLVSGFTTGAAVHVLVAQFDDIFGMIDLPPAEGAGYVFKRTWDIAVRITDQTNWAAFTCSVIAIIFLRTGKESISPRLKKRYGLTAPIPYELMVMIIATIVSWLLDLEGRFSVPVVGHIPSGFPVVALPVTAILPDCLVQSLGMTVVASAVHMSMAKMLAKRLEYTIDPSQELYALGATGLLSSLFSVYPISTALGRTMVKVSAGSKTQLAAVFSCTLVLIIILWLGPLLRTLPMCILASIIAVSLEGMFKRGDELRVLWRVSKPDFLVWVVAFFATAIINVMEGLAISIAVALLSVIFRSQWPKWKSVVGSMSSTNKGSKASNKGGRDPEVCVFRFDAPLLFTNVERFAEKSNRCLNEWDEISEYEKGPRYFILDCSSISFVDYMGAKAIAEITGDLQKRGICVYIAGVKPAVFAVLRAQGLLDTISMDDMFPTLHDALAIADRNASAAEMLASARQEQLSSLGDATKLSPSSLRTPSPISPPTPTSALPSAHILFPQRPEQLGMINHSFESEHKKE